MLRDAPNLQALWGDLIVEELVRSGVRRFVVCPGSRATPLVQAIARHPRAQATVWLDERGAGFHALGLARGHPWPAAVVTTSGTAVANLLPAVIEASLDGIPLLLLTADRPPELREVGANQSIRQTGFFADHVRWAFELPAPNTDMPARALLTTVGHAVHRAVGGFGGPVQLNCPFRAPLAPNPEPWEGAWLDDLDDWIEGEGPLTVRRPARPGADLDLMHLVRRLLEAECGIVVCGASTPPLDPSRVLPLAARLGWPVWFDARARLGLTKAPRNAIAHLDRLLEAEGGPVPDVVLQFGGRLTSRRLQAALDRGTAATYVLVDPSPSRLDPGHRVTERYVAGVDLFCTELMAALATEGPAHAAPDLRPADDAVETATAEAIEEGDDLSEPWVVRWLSMHMPAQAGLFLANSMVIRDAQRYTVADGPGLMVATNRGASGIDGIISTAAGYAQEREAETTLLIGDLAFLHDVNALAMLPALERPLTIVVLNNGGGSIFSFLPVAEHKDVLTPLVNTPHAFTFGGVCSSFGVPHERVHDRATFADAWRRASTSGVTSVIEVASGLAANEAHHARIEAAIDAAVMKAVSGS